MAVPIISFFTGLGLLDLGFHNAVVDMDEEGFESIWHNEFFPDFVHGFNYGMAALGINGPAGSIQNTQSINDIGSRRILRQAFGQGGRPNVFGIIGGPPCPDFSVGGQNRGIEGERGRLSQVYVSRILQMRPAFFLFENVPGLVRTSKHRAFLLTLMDQLSRSYYIDLRVVNALEYGVPQDRERLIMVGLKRTWLQQNGRGRPRMQNLKHLQLLLSDAQRNPNAFGERIHHWMPWDLGRTHPNAKRMYDWPTTSPFGDNPAQPPDLPEELMVGPQIIDQDILKTLPNGEEGFVPYSPRFTQVEEGDVSRKCFKRLHRWRYSPAAAYGNNEVHLHPTEPRRLTVREAMRIQTVPDTFALPSEMTLTSKFKTIGNAVPVNLAQAMATSIGEIISAVNNHTPHANI